MPCTPWDPAQLRPPVSHPSPKLPIRSKHTPTQPTSKLGPRRHFPSSQGSPTPSSIPSPNPSSQIVSKKPLSSECRPGACRSPRAKKNRSSQQAPAFTSQPQHLHTEAMFSTSKNGASSTFQWDRQTDIKSDGSTSQEQGQSSKTHVSGGCAGGPR